MWSGSYVFLNHEIILMISHSIIKMKSQSFAHVVSCGQKLNFVELELSGRVW